MINMAKGVIHHGTPGEILLQVNEPRHEPVKASAGYGHENPNVAASVESSGRSRNLLLGGIAVGLLLVGIIEGAITIPILRTSSTSDGRRLLSENVPAAATTQGATILRVYSKSGCGGYPAMSPENQRLRKEIRSMSAEEWDGFVRAVWAMKNMNQAEGEAAYGPAFRSADYITAKHAVSSDDARGDQGHSSAAFLTWHDALMLEYEMSILAIAPEVGGLPYWDITVAEPSIFTDEYMGSSPGTGEGFAVVDGRFAELPITSNFDIADWEPLFSGTSFTYFKGTDAGILRGPTNPNASPFLTRLFKPYGLNASIPAVCAELEGEQWPGMHGPAPGSGRRYTRTEGPGRHGFMQLQ